MVEVGWGKLQDSFHLIAQNPGEEKWAFWVFAQGKGVVECNRGHLWKEEPGGSESQGFLCWVSGRRLGSRHLGKDPKSLDGLVSIPTSAGSF